MPLVRMKRVRAERGIRRRTLLETTEEKFFCASVILPDCLKTAVGECEGKRLTFFEHFFKILLCVKKFVRIRLLAVVLK